MKDEKCGLSIKNFVKLKCKIHTFIRVENYKAMKAKGINKMLLKMN